MGQIKNIKLHIVTDIKKAMPVTKTKMKKKGEKPEQATTTTTTSTSIQENDEEDDPFTVEDVLYFGGEKDDYERLLNIDADEDIDTGAAGDDTEDKLLSEIEKFLQGGGFAHLQSGVYDEKVKGK